ncbi:MAG: DUF551 domain-containing protein [Ruminococcus sp.]|nr:DUF551 domain-containing protein [Ruminococcus sp.]
MRKIDADEFKSKLTDLITIYESRMPAWSPNNLLTSGRDAAMKFGAKADGVEKALALLEGMPTIEAEPAKWISVENRLPEKEANVLVWYEYFRYGDYNCLYQTYGIAAYSECYGWHGDDLNGDSVKVLYWQPLPEPPERSDET